MLAIVGIVVVLGAVAGGFTMAGGKLASLFHLSEIITIVGVAVGTVMISTPMATLKAMIARTLAVMKPSAFTKDLYIDGLKLLYELFQIARKDGLVAIEGHIEKPDASAVFKKYPKVLHEHHAIEYLCDSLRLVLVGSVPPFDLDTLMENEIDGHHEEAGAASSALQSVSDALPGIGIVAAVCGIVITMGKISGPVEEIGESVGAALTGTLLGILMAYGFLGPIATAIGHGNSAEARLFQFFRAAVVAFAKGYAPMVAVEFARKAISTDLRPTFAEMENACKGKK